MKTEIGTDTEKAAAILSAGKLVAIPTETVYGLAGNALNEEAVHLIFRIKNRPLGNPLIIHLHDADQLNKLVTQIPEAAKKLMQLFSPGPLTYLLPKSALVPDVITAGSPLVAVRFPEHPLTRELLKRLPYPLAAPSANKYTTVSPTQVSHVYKQFKDEIDYILDGGDCKKGIESTVIGFEGNDILIYRHGIVTEEQLTSAGFKVRYADRTTGPVHSPGQAALHYSPKTPLTICGDLEKEALKHKDENIAVIAFSKMIYGIPSDRQFVLSEKANPEEAASRLYTALHLMDELNAKIILTELLPETGVGKAVNDRLKRASAKGL